MRPSRTQLVLVAIAVGGLLFELVPQAIDADVSWALFNGYFLLLDFCVIVLALTYGYYVGKTGRAGPPRTIARQYLVAGLVGVAVQWATRFAITPRGWEAPDLGVMLVSSAYGFVVPFVLAGLAGVPLGAMAAQEGTNSYSAETDTDRQEQEPTDAEPTARDRTSTAGADA